MLRFFPFALCEWNGMDKMISLPRGPFCLVPDRKTTLAEAICSPRLHRVSVPAHETPQHQPPKHFVHHNSCPESVSTRRWLLACYSRKEHTHVHSTVRFLLHTIDKSDMTRLTGNIIRSSLAPLKTTPSDFSSPIRSIGRCDFTGKVLYRLLPGSLGTYIFPRMSTHSYNE